MIYKTCPECGANLDPQETCDCSYKTSGMTDKLIVGFDYRSDNEVALAVIRPKGSLNSEVINIFHGKEAMDFYTQLMRTNNA